MSSDEIEPVYGPAPLRPLNDEMRHGFEDDYTSQPFLDILADKYFNYYDSKRHNTNGNPITDEEREKSNLNYQPIPDWKIMKDRQKTVSAAIIVCLNIGSVPPDIVKTYPCAITEAWIDTTFVDSRAKGVQSIGKNLQSQYETLSLKTRYKQLGDPCVEDVKRLCNTLRRNAKDERILFHYNGHGVPQPTQSGEIWVFNKKLTQYIPVSLYDLQTWLGAPCIFVYDCNSAGNIVANFKRFVQKRIDDDNDGNHDMSAPSPTSAYIDCIQLAACKSNELLPTNPELPADLFTCCLTCPIEISIKWFIMQSPIKEKYYSKLPKNSNGNVIIPGVLIDRKTPLGELNWIFTAITDTIAWTSLSRPLFKRLFRQDLMVAALFRNFLLAKRIMPVHNCNPISDPPLPDISHHPMWESWDLAIDQVLSQLLENQKPTTKAVEAPTTVAQPQEQETIVNYQHSTFFQQQLTAFKLWLDYGSSSKSPPEQLPIVLQVLLSQAHRIRALRLLSRFLNLGPWAVYLSLSIGIFPYVLKLLQSPAQELKPVLIFIWARIMAIDYKNTQQELCKEKGYNYFYSILNGPIPGHEDEKAMCAFILTLFIKDFKNGQRLCFSIELIKTCLTLMETSESPLLRQWCSLLLAQLWLNYPDGKWIIFKDGYINRCMKLLNDPIPEVRTSIISCMTTFLTETSEARDGLRDKEINIAVAVLNLDNDGSPLVRKEIIIFFSKFISIYLNFFLISAFSQLEEEVTLIDNSNLIHEVRKNSPAYGSVFSSAWKALLVLAEDPHTEVKQLAGIAIDYVLIKLSESELGELVKEMQSYLLTKSSINISKNFQNIGAPIEAKPIDGKPVFPRRQISSNSIEQRKNMITINGSNLARPGSASVSRRNNKNRAVSEENLASKLKETLSFSNIIKTFQISNDTDLGFHKILKPVPAVYGNGTKPRTPRLRERKLDAYPALPTSSGFFEYSCEYFQEPLKAKNETDTSDISDDYIKRLWKRTRNETLIFDTQPQKELALVGDWQNVVAHMDNKSQSKLMRFTQFEKMLVSCDERDNISVWDWENSVQLSKFSNNNPFGTKITDIKFMNEDDFQLLMTGSSDGVVRIYRNFHDNNENELIAAWRALTDLLLSSNTTGLVSEWQQSRGSLLIGGDVKIIRIWDAARELCVVDIPARSSSSITSITSDQVAGNIFVSGFADGSLRAYDRRIDSRDSMIRTWKNPNSKGPIRNVHMQRGGFRELGSGTSDGLVTLWDVRSNDPLYDFSGCENSLRALEVHEHAPVIAAGSKSVHLWTTAGDLISTVENPSSYVPNRTSSYLASIAMHPHKMILATNYNQDGRISVYNCMERPSEA